MKARRGEFMQMHLNSVLTVVMLFFFGLVSPGPNFLVVVETTLRSGRAAGVVTGLGAALGDTVYASIGLFGVTQLKRVGPLMLCIELVGGLYLVWLGVRMLWHRRGRTQFHGSPSFQTMPPRALLARSDDRSRESENSDFLRWYFRDHGHPRHNRNHPGSNVARHCADISIVAPFYFFCFLRRHGAQRLQANGADREAFVWCGR